MKCVRLADEFIDALVKALNCQEIHLNVQMRRGDSWVNMEAYRNVAELKRFYASVDFDTESDLMWTGIDQDVSPAIH